MSTAVKLTPRPALQEWLNAIVAPMEDSPLLWMMLGLQYLEDPHNAAADATWLRLYGPGWATAYGASGAPERLLRMVEYLTAVVDAHADGPTIAATFRDLVARDNRTPLPDALTGARGIHA